MKRIGFLVLASLLIFNANIFAQRANQGQKTGRNDAPRQQKMTAQERANRMATELNLSEEQKAKVAEFYTKQDEVRAKKRAEHQKNRDKMRSANQADREKFRAEMDKERKAQDAELEKIIGKEKMAELVKIREARWQKMKENRDKRGTMGKNRRAS